MLCPDADECIDVDFHAAADHAVPLEATLPRKRNDVAFSVVTAVTSDDKITSKIWRNPPGEFIDELVRCRVHGKDIEEQVQYVHNIMLRRLMCKESVQCQR